MRESIYDWTFLAFTLLVAASALGVVLFRNLIHAAVALFFCLAGIAALYLMLGADFLAMSQLLIYAGGILVLLIFGIFLTARIYENRVSLPDAKGPPWYVGLAVSSALFGLIWTVLSRAQFPVKEPVHQPTTSGLGELFLTKYLLPFEVVSVLLLFVMIGAVYLVRKEVREE